MVYIWYNQSDYYAATVYVHVHTYYVKKFEAMLYVCIFVRVYAYAHMWENNICMQVCKHACRYISVLSTFVCM